MQPGQFLVNKDGEKWKILDVGVSGHMIAVESSHPGGHIWMTKDELDNRGWSLLEEPWMPKNGERYYFLTDHGSPGDDLYYDTGIDKYRRSCGNCFKSIAEISAYEKKLIERMGRKEN